MANAPRDLRASIPGVDTLLTDDLATPLVDAHGRRAVVTAMRDVLAAVRDRLPTDGVVPTAAELLDDVSRRLQAQGAHRTGPIVNATGTVLHTGLGRAPLARPAIEAMVAAAGAATAEIDGRTGERSRRDGQVEVLLRRATGAAAATVANNGAGALVLALAALAGGRAVAVSRGELVEIGGHFRLPDIVAAAGVDLVEVGTTNRTRTRDYAAAMEASPDIAAVLRVHPSNFTIQGFTERPDQRDLAALCRERGVPLVHDVGSGLLDDELLAGLDLGVDEPSMTTALADGADLVIASGDKLLGGPQAGLLLGREDLVDSCRRHPLARALRMDKVRLAALEATLELHLAGRANEVPVWAAMRSSLEDLRDRAGRLCQDLQDAGVDGVEVLETMSTIGGGSMPGSGQPSIALALPGNAEDLRHALLRVPLPVAVRIQQGRVLADLRAIPPRQDSDLLASLLAVLIP